MSDDIMAVMGLSAFGKPKKQNKLDAGRFDKTKRADEGQVSCGRVGRCWLLLLSCDVY
jgi:WD repeat-containing protein 70